MAAIGPLDDQQLFLEPERPASKSRLRLRCHVQ